MNKIIQSTEIAPTAEDEVLKSIEGAGTLAEMLGLASIHSLKTGLQTLPVSDEMKADLVRSHARWFQPWPDWVLKVMAEIFAVYYPRVRKKTVIDCLTGFRWFFFEARRHGPKVPFPPLEFPSDLAADLMGVFGHSLCHSQQVTDEIAAFEARDLTAAQYQKLEEIKAEIKKLDNRAWRRWRDYLEARTEANTFAMLEQVVEAKKATLDAEGRLRETPATAIYRRIFLEWPTVESLSGPTELCRMLNPMLGNSSFEIKVDRVRKLCSRMGIVFAKSCQRTS